MSHFNYDDVYVYMIKRTKQIYKSIYISIYAITNEHKHYLTPETIMQGIYVLQTIILCMC